jgi:dihydropyrimidinase
MGSDHSTIMPIEDKRKKDLWSSIPCFPATETMLTTLLHEGVNKGRITLEKVVELCCYNNARVFGVYPQKGEIAVGADADLVLVDLHKKVRVTPDLLHSNANYTLLNGMEMEGWPVLTMVRGTVVMRDGEIVGRPGYGRYLPRRAQASVRV